ncbi:hypothetical protein FRC09_010405 [Ceratobasidium sp. 395]|nr:hypothetical protein FRC09_010405 [Ceratobasidium sp. 395]
MIAAQAVEHDDNPESHESKPGSGKSLPRKRARANKKVTRTPERPDAPGLKRVLDMSPEVFNEQYTRYTAMSSQSIRATILLFDILKNMLYMWNEAIKESPMGWSTLRSEFAKIKGHVAEIKGLTISSWKNTRLAEMEEWHEHGYELETYLDKLDSDRREAELEALKKE